MKKPTAITAQQLWGTWRLLSVEHEEIPSGTKIQDVGASPKGYINYSPDGHMMVLWVKSDRKKPANNIATPDEASALLNSMVSYAGTYTLKEDHIIHHVEIAWNETRIGKDLTRFYQLQNNQLTLTTAPFIDPVHSKKIIARLVWKKIL